MQGVNLMWRGNADIIRKDDDQYLIDKCLSCPKKECTNCLSGGRKPGKGVFKKYDEKAFAKLFRQGKTRKEICEALNMPKSTYRAYRIRLEERKG